MTNNNTKKNYTFTFTDRESYKQFVRDWKTLYKSNSQAIRDLKREIKELQKAGDDKASTLQMRRQWLRNEQREALAYRAAAKEEAQRQYEAQKLQDAA